MRTIFWDYEKAEVKMIDQRLLPETFSVVSYSKYLDVARAITDMVIRGAPAIGAAAAFGLALAARESAASNRADFLDDMRTAGTHLKSARPTAVNLAWAVDLLLGKLFTSQSAFETLRDFILVQAQNLADEDVVINKRMATLGADLIADGDTIIHHCN